MLAPPPEAAPRHSGIRDGGKPSGLKAIDVCREIKLGKQPSIR
jgi:hypothetical protein